MDQGYDKIEEKTNNIVKNLHKLNNNICVVKKKIIVLDNINSKLTKHKILKLGNDNIQFQSDVLKNEFTYYSNLYDIIVDKYSKELYELTEYILIILLSLNKFEIDNNQSKKDIYNKIIFTKKNSNVSTGKLKEIVNNIINNLKVVNEFISLFDSYIEKYSETNNSKNIHNSNYELNIKYKKKAILLEYNKYCDKFNKIIDYFSECLVAVISQIESSELLNFLLQLKTIEKK